MDLKLHGKKALITGSSKGIGEAIAPALAREGAIETTRPIALRRQPASIT